MYIARACVYSRLRGAMLTVVSDTTDGKPFRNTCQHHDMMSNHLAKQRYDIKHLKFHLHVKSQIWYQTQHDNKPLSQVCHLIYTSSKGDTTNTTTKELISNHHLSTRTMYTICNNAIFQLTGVLSDHHLSAQSSYNGCIHWSISTHSDFFFNVVRFDRSLLFLVVLLDVLHSAMAPSTASPCSGTRHLRILVDHQAHTRLGNDIGGTISELSRDNGLGCREAEHREQVRNWVGASADHCHHLRHANSGSNHCVRFAGSRSRETDKDLVHDVHKESHGGEPSDPTRS